MTPIAWLSIGVITVTIIYTIIRFIRDGNIEKDTLAILIGGLLVGMAGVYYFFPLFQTYVRDLWNLLFRRY
jgi:uncharacterized membrane protein YuzA (DUF378 family)